MSIESYCPKCGKKLDYSSFEQEDEVGGYYPITCKCGFIGTEHYSLIFTHQADTEGNIMGED